MFCREKPRGTVASHAWPFLLRGIRLEALSYRRRMPEKRNTPKHTSCRGHSEVSQRQQSRNVVSGVGFDVGFDVGFVSVFNGLNLT
jgi:hypothetical protein